MLIKGDKDEREVYIELTNLGQSIKKEAYNVPLVVGTCVKLEKDEVTTLYKLLYKILRGFDYE